VVHAVSAEPRAPAGSAGAEPEQDSAFGRLPLLLGEREYGTWGAHGTCFAYAIATWCFLTGGYAANLVGAVEGFICLVAGNTLGVFLTTMPLSLGCNRYGLEQIDFCKPSFGQHGAHLILVFYLVNMIGWSGLILVMFGNGLVNIFEALGYEPGRWLVGLGVAVGIWLSYLICTRGVHLLKVTNAFITPGLGLLVAFMFYMLLTEYGWETIAAAPPLEPSDTPLVNYAICVELGIASGFSWWGGIGFLARNTRSRRNSVYPEILQLGVAAGVVCSIALFSALVVQSDDPTEWMVPLGGVFMGVLALIFVALANVSSTAVSLFASGLALRHVPGLRGIAWWKIIVLTIVPCVPFVFWPAELYDLGDRFLAYNGTMFAPISGILFVDFLFLRGQKLALWSIFESAPEGAYHHWRGFNLWGLGSLVLGQVAYVWLYDPASGETHDWFRFLPASLAAFGVPAVLYGIGMTWFAKPEPSPPTHLIDPNI
jgi:NCS1 family nucleobase:cation symporter-1